jgi:hypothetical protein
MPDLLLTARLPGFTAEHSVGCRGTHRARPAVTEGSDARLRPQVPTTQDPVICTCPCCQNYDCGPFGIFTCTSCC